MTMGRYRRRRFRRRGSTFGSTVSTATWRRQYYRGDGTLTQSNSTINTGNFFTLVNPATEICRVRGELRVSALTRVATTDVASTGRISHLSFAVGVLPDGLVNPDLEETRARIWRRLRRMSVPGYPVELATKLPPLVVREDSSLKLAIWVNDIEVSSDEIYYTWMFHGWEQFYDL